jgi:hypothetical protein
MRELYGAVWRVSGREQVLLVALALFVAGLASVPLRFQQLAINGLVERPDVHALAWNCAGFVCAILLSVALKFVLGLRLSVVGERVVRLIRERLYATLVDDVARDPAAAAQRVGSWPCSTPKPSWSVRSPALPWRVHCTKPARWRASSPSSQPASRCWGWWRSPSSCRRPASSWRCSTGSTNASGAACNRCGDASDRISAGSRARGATLWPFYRMASTVRVKYAMLLPAIASRG